MKDQYDDVISKLIGESVPGTSMLFRGQSGKIQDGLALQFLASHLLKGGVALVLVSKMSPEKYYTHLEKYGLDVKRCISENRLLLVDWYSYTRKVVIGIQEDLGVIRSSRDILNLSISVSKAMDKLPASGQRLAVIDFLDTAIDTFGWKTVHEYVRKIMETLRNDGMTSLLLSDENLDEEIQRSLKSISDAVIDIDEEDDKTTIYLESLGLDYLDTEELEIKIDEGMISLGGANGFFSGHAVEKLGLTAKDFIERSTGKRNKKAKNGNGKSNSRGGIIGKINGRVNGKVNGKTNGRINGKTNGRINGKTNGRINGRVNGKVNGKTNGRINGRVNGKVNGKTNGRNDRKEELEQPELFATNTTDSTSLSADDGLINGLGGVSGPTKDFSGTIPLNEISLPDDEGLINGFAVSEDASLVQGDTIKDTFDMSELFEEERRLKPRGGGSDWFKKGIGVVVIMFFLLFLPVMLNILYVPVEERISIDGDFDDWRAVRAYFDPPAPHDIESIDIREYKLVESDGFLYMYLQTLGDLFMTGERVSSIRFFIDIDTEEGYSIGGLRAEYMLEIYGWEGELKGTSFHNFNRSRDMNDWNGYQQTGSARVHYSDNELETRIWIGSQNDDVSPQIFIHTMAGDHWDYSEGRVIPEKDSIVGRVEKVGPRVVQPGETVPILQLSAFSLSGEATLDNLTIDYNEYSEEYIDEIILYEGDINSVDIERDNPLYRVSNFNGSAILNPNDIVNETITDYLIAAKISTDATYESVIGLHISGMEAREGIASIQKTRVDNVYVSNIPAEPRVNGAFIDWNYQPVWDDPLDDLSPVGTWNPNIDIRQYSAVGSTAFMMSVEGNMLGGVDVPYARGRPPELVDSDGDGIPDIYDPFPNDFTNDGTPDSEMLTPEGLPDVDGDGVADWPYGPDKWLNTTIPEHPDIPEEYWGREVSRYIGPVILPVRTGEDYVRIFIDADSTSSTGYSAPWLTIGAEYMIEIRGRNMDVTQAEYYRYTGTRTDWSWESMGEVPVALNATSIETALDTQALGIPDDFEVAFVATDWQNNLDTALINENNMDDWRTRSSSERYRLYLRDNSEMLYGTGDTEEIVTLDNKGPISHNWNSPPLAGDIEISGTMYVHMYLVPGSSGSNHPGLQITISHEGGTLGTGELPSVSSSGWYTISVPVESYTIPTENTISLETTITGEAGKLSMDIYHNSEARDSRLSIPTTTHISVDDLYTLDDDGEEQNFFQPGELVDVNAEVTHPLTTELISEVSMSVYYPDDTPFVQDQVMSMKEVDISTPPYWNIFNGSFILEEESPRGIYRVEVTATDMQGIKSVNETTFIIPVDPGVAVYPDVTGTTEPGSWISYNVQVQNIGNVDEGYILTVSESSRGWATELSHGGDVIATDDDGNGNWDWVDPTWDANDTGAPVVYMVPEDKMTFTVSKYAPEHAKGQQDTTSFFAHSQKFEDVFDYSILTTNTPYLSTSKALYLHDGFTMDTMMGTSTTSTTVPADGSQTWTQEPPLERDLSLIDYATVHLYIIPDIQGHQRPDVSVSLSESGSFINSFSIHGIDTEGWYEFPIGTDVLLSEGNQLEVTVSSGTRGIDLNYDSGTYPARVEFNTDSYIRLEEIRTFLDETETDEFSAGDTVTIRARISDPFGAYNIAGAIMNITDPDGVELVTEQPMTVMENGLLSDTVGIWYEGDYTLSEEAVVGDYTAEVTATDEQSLEDEGDSLFQVPAGVEVEPDHEGEAQAGTIVEYQHTVTNLGRGNDRFELSASSSLGFNVTLLDEEGNIITNTGVLKMGESINITVRIEIPEDAETGMEDVTTITATSMRDGSISDSATDTTSISEFTDMMLPIGFVFFMFFGWFVHRRMVLDKNVEVKEKEIPEDKSKVESKIPQKEVVT